MSAETRVGYDFAHAIVDDHSRLAYVELLPVEKAASITPSSRARSAGSGDTASAPSGLCIVAEVSDARRFRRAR
jgi:hypothetical protein